MSFTIFKAEDHFHARPEAVKQSGDIRGSFGRILFLLLPLQKSMKIRSLQSENRDSLSERSLTLRSAVQALKVPHSDQKRGDTD